MVRSILSLGALSIAFIDIIGYRTLSTYLSTLNIPFRLGNLQILDLPSWGLPVILSSPLAVGVIVAFLLATAYSGFLSSFRADVVTLRVPPPGKRVDFISFFGSYFSATNRGSTTFRKVCQILALSILFLLSMLRAEQVGGQLASDAINGRVSNSAPAASARQSYSLVLKPGAKLPHAAELAQRDANLSILWQDDKMLYLTRLHPVHSSNQKYFYNWYSISQDALASVAYTKQWSMHWDKAAVQDNSVWPNVMLASLALFMIGISIWAYLEARDKTATLRECKVGDIDDFGAMPEFVAENVFSAIQNGQDVVVVKPDANGKIKKYWFRSSMFAEGMHLEKTADSLSLGQRFQHKKIAVPVPE